MIFVLKVWVRKNVCNSNNFLVKIVLNRKKMIK